ncbi:MAG: YdcH family protein [Mangrovicoccus sp.]|nr:YdcH family protein [Mangrovicoccus sp.]
MSMTSHLEELRKKHAVLSKQVEDAERCPSTDALAISGMKKQKLFLKEQITRLAPHG